MNQKRTEKKDNKINGRNLREYLHFTGVGGGEERHVKRKKNMREKRRAVLK